jgi:hypothetical protein
MQLTFRSLAALADAHPLLDQLRYHQPVVLLGRSKDWGLLINEVFGIHLRWRCLVRVKGRSVNVNGWRQKLQVDVTRRPRGLGRQYF